MKKSVATLFRIQILDPDCFRSTGRLSYSTVDMSKSLPVRLFYDFAAQPHETEIFSACMSLPARHDDTTQANVQHDHQRRISSSHHRIIASSRDTSYQVVRDGCRSRVARIFWRETVPMRSTMVYVQEIREPRPSRAWWRGRLATGGVLVTLFIQWTTCRACEGVNTACCTENHVQDVLQVTVLYCSTTV